MLETVAIIAIGHDNKCTASWVVNKQTVEANIQNHFIWR